MLLRHRLALMLSVTLILALAGIVVLTDAIYRPLQNRQLAGLLERDLARIAAVVETGSVGRSFLAEDMRELTVQFVSNGGRVLLPEAGAEPLPLHWEPAVVRDGQEAMMVGATPWRLPSGLQAGTIRVALDVGEALASQRTLRTSLVLSGVSIALLASLIVVVVVRGALKPLLRLAAEADAVDVSAPRLARYRGPDDEVARVAAALNRALDGIRERQQAERDALAEVAHELAAPLTVVAGHLRALERRDGAGGGPEPRLTAAREAADELLHTSQDLLTLARGELERTPDLSVVDVGVKARNVAGEYPGVGIDCGPDDLRVLANAERLRQVVRNLVRNAVQASGGVAGVGIRCRCEGAEVVLEVHDEGPGLAPEARERVFERYYSGRRGAGAGIGLAVVQRIVETFGGSVGVHSALGHGSTFSVRLPSLASQTSTGREGDGGA